MDPARRAARDAGVTFAIVAVAVTGLVQIKTTLPGIGNVGSALVAVVFLYAPIVAAHLCKRDETLEDYGFSTAPLGKGLATAGVAMLIAFPLFVAIYIGFFATTCGSADLSRFAPPGMCSNFHGLSSIHAPDLKWWPPISGGPPEHQAFPEFCLIQWVVVALPEELFFRGFLLKLLEQRFVPKRRVWGGGVGLALVLSSLAFAIVHVPARGFDPRELVKFFPGLLFGWMRSRTGSIFAGTLTHGASNILVNLLEKSVLR